jgi:threonine/homoserine/homoserine lactone efflux protein
MPESLVILLKGILLGLGAAVPIGPVNVEIARRTLRQGFRFGVALGAGAVTVDMTYAVVASVGWAPLIGNRWVVNVLGTAGILLLLYLAAMCFRGVGDAVRPWSAIPSDAAPEPNPGPGAVSPEASVIPGGPSARSTYLTGLLMTFFNPMTLAFWFVVLPGLAARLTDHPPRDLPLLCAGVFLGAFSWVLTFSGALAVAGRFKRGLWITLADAVGGVVLLGFAVAAAVRLLRNG